MNSYNKFDIFEKNKPICCGVYVAALIGSFHCLMDIHEL